MYIFPSRIYSFISPSIFQVLLRIASLANSIFFRISFASQIWNPCPPLPLSSPTSISFWHFSRYFASYLVPVFIPYLSVVSFPVPCLSASSLCHCSPCHLLPVFLIHAKRPFPIVSSVLWMSGLAQVRNEIKEQAWGEGAGEDIPPHFGAVSISRILETRMVGPVNTKIPWDKTGVGFPLLSVSYIHLIFPDHFLSFLVRQFFMLPHKYEELWGLYSLGNRSDNYSALSQRPEWQFSH